MRNEKRFKKTLSNTQAKIWTRLRHGQDVPIPWIYATLYADGPQRTLRYQQQCVGAIISRINRKLIKFGECKATIRVGQERHTYRLYATGE